MATNEKIFDAAHVPRAFWAMVNLPALRGIKRLGRLTLPEREHLWELLGNTGRPPVARIRFDDDLLRTSAPRDDEDEDAALMRLLQRLQGGRHV